MSEYIPAAEVENYNPLRHEFIWNDDYTAFIPVRLRWWDNESYIAYQAGTDCDDDEMEREPPPPYGLCGTARGFCDDGCPF